MNTDSGMRLPGSVQMARFRGGRSRQLTSYNLDTCDKTIHLKSGTTTTIAETRGAGIVTRVWLTFGGWFWQHWNPSHPIDQRVLRSLVFRAYWDGEDEPSIEAPMGDFFGIGHCEYRHFMSQHIGMSSGGFYCYFPMPFSRGLRFEVANEHEVDNWIFVNINYQEFEELPDDFGRFHARFDCGFNEPGKPWVVTDAKGRGHYVGCTMSFQGQDANYLGYLEGPERIYIDDEQTPSIYGTGTEDYFNGGWYFREGEFAGPYHGAPLKDALRSMVSVYRFHDADAITFEKSIRVTFVHGHRNDAQRSIYSSVGYWYQTEPHIVPWPFPDLKDRLNLYRMRDFDHQSIP